MALNLDYCGACRAPVGENARLAFSPQGFGIRLTPPWRMRNAATNELGLPGVAAVLLCSDMCEQRYQNEIGFAEE